MAVQTLWVPLRSGRAYCLQGWRKSGPPVTKDEACCNKPVQIIHKGSENECKKSERRRETSGFV